jgi:hypothetical protein
MKALSAFAALLLAGAHPPQEQATLTVASGPSADGKIKLEGTVPVPDGSNIRLTLLGTSEAATAGRTGIALSNQGNVAPAMVQAAQQKKVSFELSLKNHGYLRANLMHQGGAGRWTVGIPAWDDTMIPKVVAAFPEAQALVKEGRALVEKVKGATGSKSAWDGKKAALLEELGKYIEKAQGEPLKGPYPATIGAGLAVVNYIQGTSADYKWEGGKFLVKNVYGEVKDFEGKPYSFATYLKYMDEAEAMAGREFALWIAKDVRRGGDPKKLALEVQKLAKQPAVAPFAPKLAGLTRENAEKVELEIRNEK